jgi:hypothetical protein
VHFRPLVFSNDHDVFLLPNLALPLHHRLRSGLSPTTLIFAELQHNYLPPQVKLL